MAGMIPISLINPQTSAFVILGTLHRATHDLVSTDSELLYRSFSFRLGKHIAFARKPGIQRWQQEDPYHQVGNEPTDDNDCKGPLRIRSDTVRKSSGKQAQSR